MRNIFKRLTLTLASAGMMTIYGCGGGGGTTSTDSPDISSTKVTPSLGQFSAGTTVNLTKPDSTLLSSGIILADGTVTLTYTAAYTGPIVVTVLGGANVTYFDESTGLNTPFGEGAKLRAVIPAPQAQVGVTALTNAAIENLAAAGGISSATAATVNDANAKVAAVFNMTDILVAPTPVNNRTGKTLDLASPGDKYAMVLAAFAKAAPSGTSAAVFAVTLALDLKDGKLDAKDGKGLTPAATLPNAVTANELVASYQRAAQAYATADSEKVAASLPLTVTPDVTKIVQVSNQTDVTLAKALFAELRTTFNSLSNGNATGFLDTKPASIKDDINANVASEFKKTSYHITVLNNAIAMYEDAKELTLGSTRGFIVGVDPLDPTKPALIRSSGSMFEAWNGYSDYSYCWTDSTTPTSINKVSCSAAGTDSGDRINNKLKLIKLALTPGTSSNQYSYQAFRYNKTVTFALNSTDPIFGTSETVVSIPQGSGTLEKTVSGITQTGLAFNGTMPPSTSSTGIDNIAISAVRTPLTGNNYHYALSGSVSTANAANSAKVVTLSLDSGTYFDLDETPNNEQLIAAKIVGSATTAASKFTGTFDIGAVQKDNKGANATPTAMAFTGVISDLTTGGAGQF